MRGLLIAEKPSLRRTIEEVYKAHKSEIPYELNFIDQRGHLLTLKYPDEIDEDQKEWCWENLPFHPEDHGGWQYKVIEEKKVGSYLTSSERYQAIKEELASGKYDFVVNAGDPDQEGELLIRIVLSALHNRLPVKRYWSNDTTEAKVLEALKNLKDDDHEPMLVNLLAAAYGRQHSDYRFGMNISRAATLKLGTMAACGRVKTPILAIVCKREHEIANFVPKTCYGVIANYSDGFTGQLFDKSEVPEEKEEESSEKEDQEKGIVWFDTKEEADELIAKLSSPVTVTHFESKRVESYAPKLFKLATAQVAMGKFGLNSSQTLQIIQSLYEKGFVSYPRTDCEYISSGEDFHALVRSASSIPMLEPFIKSIDPSAYGKVKATKKWVNDKKLTEAGHSALVPTTKAPDFEKLSNEEKLVYTMICRQFVAIFLPPLVQDKTVLITEIDGHTFKSTGKTLVDPGYTKIFGTKFTDNEIPPYKEGDSVRVDSYGVSTKTTTCPKRFTDADLIAVCESPHKYLDDKRLKALGKRLVIGTPATRASIINELIVVNKYLQRVKEKKTEYIIPTTIGMEIYENLKDLDICKVDLTGIWEEQLEKVRKGEMTLSELEDGMRTHVDALVENIKTNTDITKIESMKRVAICKCPKCGGDIMSGPKGFSCSNKKEGCMVGAYKKICDTTIKDQEFADLVAGKTISMTIKKGEKKWVQDLAYNFDENKIEFVKAAPKASEYSCPKCGSVVQEDSRKFSCTENCGFTLWKTACGKMLTKEQVDSFFKTGKTGMIKGLKSKSGKPFDANLVLNEDKTGTVFEFAPRKK